MGRKSSAKSQNRPSSSGSGAEPPELSRRSYTGLLTVTIVVLAAGVGVYVATRPGQSEPPAAPARAAQVTPDGPAANARFGPHKQDQLPPLPYDPAPARPPEVARAAYVFAAEHPEVAAYVPCYCGCENMGHRGNDECFVKARNDKGDVTEWEPHGMT